MGQNKYITRALEADSENHADIDSFKFKLKIYVGFIFLNWDRGSFENVNSRARDTDSGSFSAISFMVHANVLVWCVVVRVEMIL